MGRIEGVDSEIGRLRAVLMHRPGPELQRITPRHAGRLLFAAAPWASKARQEHDALCAELRARGVDVLYLTQLLQDVLEYEAARHAAISRAVADARLGDDLRAQLRAYLADQSPEQLCEVLVAGLTPAELRTGSGVVYELLGRHDFVLDPLPNLVFTRDTSFWVGPGLAVASLAAPSRRREAALAMVVYRHHPMFAGTTWLYDTDLEHLDGGDVVLLGPGVVAVGTGERTTPAGAERLARRLFDAGLATAVLAVPLGPYGGRHLDTICTVIDADAVIMHPAVAYALTAHTITSRDGALHVSRAQPFLQAAARSLGLPRLEVIDAATEPGAAQWDDGGNVLAVGRRLAVSHERNARANARLQARGVEVVTVAGSELSSSRGGPRCMTCPLARETVVPQRGAPSALPARAWVPPSRTAATRAGQLPVPAGTAGRSA